MERDSLFHKQERQVDAEIFLPGPRASSGRLDDSGPRSEGPPADQIPLYPLFQKGGLQLCRPSKFFG